MRKLVICPYYFFKNAFIYVYVYVYVFCLHICICTTFEPGAHKGQDRVLGPLGLELYMVVCYHVSAGD